MAGEDHVSEPTGSPFAVKIHFTECETPEPSLGALIYRYYRDHFDQATADDYADRYIEAVKAGVASPATVRVGQEVIDRACAHAKEMADRAVKLKPVVSEREWLSGPGAKPNDWMEWKGGDRPVASDQPVEVRFRSGFTDNRCLAWDWSWEHVGSGGDIVAYRIAAPEPRRELKSSDVCGESDIPDGTFDALRAAPVFAPQGWKLMPVEPTQEMEDLCGRATYQLLLHAAPAAPVAAPLERPDRQWYEGMIRETLDDDFVIGPAGIAVPVAAPQDWMKTARILAREFGSACMANATARDTVQWQVQQAAWDKLMAHIERAAPVAAPVPQFSRNLLPRLRMLAASLRNGMEAAQKDVLEAVSLLDGRVSAPVAAPHDLHPETADLVRRFAAALTEKLAAAEKKYAYSDNWMQPDWMDECRQKLREHIEKGDPRDVAAYCAFLWHHGESTAAPVAAPQDPTDEELLFFWRKAREELQDIPDKQATFLNAARAVLKYRGAAPVVAPQPLPDGLKAVIDKAAETRQTAVIDEKFGPVFINYGDTEQQLESDASLNCPHCGGSGHKDDVAAPVAAPAPLTNRQIVAKAKKFEGALYDDVYQVWHFNKQDIVSFIRYMQQEADPVVVLQKPVEKSLLLSSPARLQARIEELEDILQTVQQSLREYGDRMPDGFGRNGRLYRWVDDALSGVPKKRSKDES